MAMATIFGSDLEQNIRNKIEKSNKIAQDKKSLISTYLVWYLLS